MPELGLSVFEVPRQAVKGRQRARILVCNSVAQFIIESIRGQHPEYVFVYRYSTQPKVRSLNFLIGCSTVYSTKSNDTAFEHNKGRNLR